MAICHSSQVAKQIPICFKGFDPILRGCARGSLALLRLHLRRRSTEWTQGSTCVGVSLM
ncbi:hypothetical protein ES288_A08G183500v1 [Gossypium darwinii]|uniref:Uncharacterized protein n=1 Tax=Gossypium darwinii TaxID=34276 RepID=A0A5D2FL09_GOSDA|nr:hypothetical protein ES288_A08G183500v1 [Gossypium darwinii]